MIDFHEEAPSLLFSSIFILNVTLNKVTDDTFEQGWRLLRISFELHVDYEFKGDKSFPRIKPLQ